MLLLSKIRSSVRCPVCSYVTSAPLCPYSTPAGGTFEGKGVADHESLSGIYRSKDDNPYWSEVNYGTRSEIGFRLGWTQVELDRIYADACRGAGVSPRLSASPLTAPDMPNAAFLAPEHLYMLTADEVYALCIIEAFHAKEFPETEVAVNTGMKMFAGYDIPPDMIDKVFDVFAKIKNVMRAVSERGSAKFRGGLSRLLMRWSVPPFYGLPQTMYDAVSIKPAIGMEPDIKTASEDRAEYARLVAKHGYDAVFSHLYYYVLPKAKSPEASKRTWDDMLWLMRANDKPDFFGVPGFVFLPEDRLVRLLFLLCISAIRGEAFVKAYWQQMSTACPYLTMTPEVWGEEPELLWPREAIADNVNVHKGYVGAISRLGPQWIMSEDTVFELYTRFAGIEPKRKFVSAVTGRSGITDIDRLQSGLDHKGAKVLMLNFKACLALIAPFIRSPSPLPYSKYPRYGLLRCAACGDLYYIDRVKSANCGSFDRIDDKEYHPVPRSASVFRIAMRYACQKCGVDGARELDVALTTDCKKCGSPDGRITAYEFYGDNVNYTTTCPVCGEAQDYREHYDAERDIGRFDGGSTDGDITPMHAKGPHGEDLFMLSDPSDPAIVKIIEMPYNLRSDLEPEGRLNTGATCPYEIAEMRGRPSHSGACQNMPHAYNKYAHAPTQFVLVRPGGSAKHRTHKVGTLKMGDGTVIDRFECEDHKAAVAANVEALRTGSAKLLKRGHESWSVAPAKGGLTPIADVTLDPNRVDATLELMKVPLAISTVSGVAKDQAGLDESMKYFRALTAPDTPIYEGGGTAPAGMASVAYKDDSRLAAEVRHLYTFDQQTPPPPKKDTPCDELCKGWENLELIRATMPMDRDIQMVRVRHKTKYIRAWDISHSPSYLVPTMSIPFIPTITPKERRVKKYYRERLDRDMTGLVVVLVDESGSMTLNRPGQMRCPYLMTPEETAKCGKGYSWNASKKCAIKVMDCNEIATRVTLAIVNDAKQRRDAVMIFGFTTSIRPIVGAPSKDYDGMTDMLINGAIKVGGSTSLPTSLSQLADSLAEAKKSNPKIKKAVVIVITDGDIGSPQYQIYTILDKYGPVYIYQVAKSDTVSYRKKQVVEGLKGAGWNPESGEEFDYKGVDVSDGGLTLTGDISKRVNKNLKRRNLLKQKK